MIQAAHRQAIPLKGVGSFLKGTGFRTYIGYRKINVGFSP
jgi:hypothetical protein